MPYVQGFPEGLLERTGLSRIRQDYLRVSREHSTVIRIKFLVNYLEVFSKTKVPYAL